MFAPNIYLTVLSPRPFCALGWWCSSNTFIEYYSGLDIRIYVFVCLEFCTAWACNRFLYAMLYIQEDGRSMGRCEEREEERWTPGIDVLLELTVQGRKGDISRSAMIEPELLVSERAPCKWG